jgi:ankyrin repeat protein
MDLAQISQVDNALLQACLEGNEDALAHAVRHGALATRARDAMGATPLHMACLAATWISRPGARTRDWT